MYLLINFGHGIHLNYKEGGSQQASSFQKYL